MTWPDIVGHEQVLQRFRRSLELGRLASTFLFVGPPGVGKRTLALKLAQALLCESTPPDQLTACQACPGCRQAAAMTHPDLILIQKPADRNVIPVELLIGDREHRMQIGLCHDISLKPYRGQRKIAIIDDADHLNQEGANCLLKTLEEPPPDAVLILIGTSQQRQLPTIQSRCQIVRFVPLSCEQVAQLLLEKELVQDTQQARQLAARSGGSLQRAMELIDDDIEDMRQTLFAQLSTPDFDLVTLIKELTSFVDAAGKEAPPRRQRLRGLIDAAATFYRGLMRALAGDENSMDPVAAPFVAKARETWTGDAPLAADCLQRCLDALAQVDANANLSTLIAAWLDDLAQRSLPTKA